LAHALQNQSTEDYLKGIYQLRRRTGAAVSTSDLARHLKIGDGSVTDMLKRLSSKKLLHYVPYKGVTLTEEGTKLAMKTIRRHRLWEMFLVRHLGYSWDEVHEEAERLEHVTSVELEKRLDRALGSPSADPHGDPIPTPEGELTEFLHKSLAECREGGRYRIARVSDESPEALQYLRKLGLTLNKRITVRQLIRFDGSVTVEWNKRELVLSAVLARNIFVEEV
jgi:DtxR family Mn-dependent transcriptional regulator